MSTTFTKLFSSITESTIWAEPDSVRIVWITMLAMADRHGRIWASIPGLANRARVSLAACEDALDRFQKPDKYSRTPDHEGRRVEPIDGGWRLLNHAKYRAIRDEESALEAKRKYAAKKRSETKVEKVDQSRSPSNKVESSRDNAEADSDAEADSEKHITPPNPLKGALPDKPSEGEKPAKTKKQRKPTQRNPLIDAIVEACGGDIPSTTRPAWAQAATALRDIKEVQPNVTAEDIKAKASTYRRLHPDWDLTSSALAKHWGSLVERKKDLFDGEDWRKCL
jgi:hypothetical protein